MSEPRPRETTVSTEELSHEAGTLARTWQLQRGFVGFLKEVDHKRIGLRFIITALGFFTLGGILAALMRIQLAFPDNTFLGPDLYNQIFTMHGTTMMFLFAVPVMEGMGVYFVPLLVGARAIAFPRLVAFGYWMFLAGGIFFYVSFFLNIGPDNGWFSYTPLAGPEFAPGKRQDIWSQLITFTELSGLVVAVSIIVTIFKYRAPGMSIDRMPMFVWSELITAFIIVFALPAVMMASTNLILDRLVGTHFFNQAEGGDALLWQHLFWFFGHPEVYLIFLPAQGMMSMLIQAFSGRPVVGYTALVVALVATAFLGFGLWVHHMFASGLPQVGSSFFTAASMMVAIPSGVQIFCWISTLWSGHVRWKTPLMYALGYFAIFIIGGLTGVMLASVPLNLQVHDTYFVVAHFHYVLIGGAVFPLFGMLHYWFPKMTGYMLNERLGHTAFWGLFIGFNLTFFPMHQLGMYGMPRRVYTYSAGLGWELPNLLATVGAVLMMLSMVVLLTNVIQAFRRRVPAGDSPWDASTLDWATSSPPPSYNFHPLPTVSSRDPLWDEPDRNPVIIGVPSDSRDILITTALDAEADHLTESPYPSVWPFHTSLAVTALFIGSIFTPWAVVWFAVPVSVALVKWFWPSGIEAEEEKPTLVSETAGHDFPAAVNVRPEAT